jgi:hypothetical protein
MEKKKKDLILLIPGFYADPEGRVYLNMREFLFRHDLPDSPEVRAVVWEEARQMFADIEINELPD